MDSQQITKDAIELVDKLVWSLDTCLVYYGGSMHEDDYRHRTSLVKQAKEFIQDYRAKCECNDTDSFCQVHNGTGIEGPSGRQLCPKCLTEEGVHGGCDCGHLAAWMPPQ